jgi:uncharacterized protein DUF4038
MPRRPKYPSACAKGNGVTNASATRQVSQYEVAEVSLGPAEGANVSASVNLVVRAPNGRERRIPAFVSRGAWRARYSSEQLGTHRYHAETSDGVVLSHPEGTIDIVESNSSAHLRSHGPVRVASDRRHLEHADGTPFLWLADTWWYGFTERLSITEFRSFAAQRAEQGFSVVQIVAGLYPETTPFQPEARSASGWVWHEDLSGPNSAWFDEADERVHALLEHDLVPCIVGSWGHFLGFMSVEQMLRHWRELIARWGAYPVVWCLAGEPSFPWGFWDDETLRTLAAQPTIEDTRVKMKTLHREMVSEQLRRVNDVARGVRELEPFGRPITIHSVPDVQPWENLDDDSLVDIWFLQTGHQGQTTLEPSVNAIHDALAREPSKPVINGEPSYEGIAGSSWQDMQRFFFWSHLLSGTAGHSYGAHGVWGFNTPEYPGFGSGLAPVWQEAADLPGAAQVGLGRRLLLELPWHRFEPHPDWVVPHQHVGDRLLPYAAGLEDGLRVFYFPGIALVRNSFSVMALQLHALGKKRWHAQLISPRTGVTADEFAIEPEADGTARLRCGYRGGSGLPSWEDWLLILRQEK